MTAPLRHLSDDLLRSHAIGAASEGAGLVVACHVALCPLCAVSAAGHESVLDALARALCLTDDERTHLYALARPVRRPGTAPVSARVVPAGDRRRDRGPANGRMGPMNDSFAVGLDLGATTVDADLTVVATAVGGHIVHRRS